MIDSYFPLTFLVSTEMSIDGGLGMSRCHRRQFLIFKENVTVYAGFGWRVHGFVAVCFFQRKHAGGVGLMLLSLFVG